MAKVIKTDSWHFKAFRLMLSDDREKREKELNNLTICAYWRIVLLWFPMLAAIFCVCCVIASPFLFIEWLSERPAIAKRLKGWNKRVDEKLESIRFCEFATFDREVK